jgi:7-carboxy-7-deazaguanine synthase
MKIAEIYASLQGEGLLAGTPSGFVRTSGCNLRCRWCDTPFTSWEPTGTDQTTGDVYTEVVSLGLRHVVVTGGEPLLFPDVADLCVALRRDGFHVTIETAGTVLPAVPAATLADLMSISPKLGSSAPDDAAPGGWRQRHDASRRRDDVLRELCRGPHQLKFVVTSPADIDELSRWLDDLGIQDRRQVFLMPQGCEPDDLAAVGGWLEQECRRQGYRFATRHHIAWFGHTRGT